MINRYSNEAIINKIRLCLGILYKNDSFLIHNFVNERSITHKLAEYMQKAFPDWNVDCEYNKKEINIKELDNINECSEQKKTDRIFPDIIVHRRNSEDNLLVIELKNGTVDNCDLVKLELLTDSSGSYKYQLGLFIKLNGKENSSLFWFADGKRISL